MIRWISLKFSRNKHSIANWFFDWHIDLKQRWYFSIFKEFLSIKASFLKVIGASSEEHLYITLILVLIQKFIQSANIIPALNLIRYCWRCCLMDTSRSSWGASWRWNKTLSLLLMESLLLCEILNCSIGHLYLEVVNFGTKLLQDDTLSFHLIIKILSWLDKFLFKLWFFLDHDSWPLFPHVEEIVTEHLKLSL